MSENFNSYSEDLLCDLSEAEQETLSAGQCENIPVQANFFLQNTNIQTEGNSNVNLGGDSSLQTTKYNLSQFTVGSSVSFVLPNISSGINNWQNLLSSLINGLFA